MIACQRKHSKIVKHQHNLHSKKKHSLLLEPESPLSGNFPQTHHQFPYFPHIWPRAPTIWWCCFISSTCARDTHCNISCCILILGMRAIGIVHQGQEQRPRLRRPAMMILERAWVFQISAGWWVLTSSCNLQNKWIYAGKNGATCYHNI